MKRPLYFICVLTCFLFVEICSAAITLPAIVSSHMVLQRNTTVQVWGWAEAHESITIKASWLQNPIKTEASAGGEWRVSLKTTNSKQAQWLSLKSENSDIMLDDILFGEVWLCSGQSNMYQPIKGYGNAQPTANAQLARVMAEKSQVRLFSVTRKNAKLPLSDLKDCTSWQQATSETCHDFSAIAWFFGQQLQAALDVPVGMIHSSWGGTRVEAWMSKEALGAFEVVDLDNMVLKEAAKNQPTILYNAMVHPLIPFTIKGVLWYQGEANRKAPEKYKKLFPAMVKDWRSRWGIGDFPFYFVQIAPYDYSAKDSIATMNRNSAFMRVAQEECVSLIPNSGIAITTDLGDEHRIHPSQKQEVANRLLLLALEQTYGFENVDGSSPVYDVMTVYGNEIQLKFKNAELGLFAFDELTDFEIAGEDKVFYPASAKIEGDTLVVVTSINVPAPKAVRYAWKDWVKGSLYNQNLLPASSFRTDHWTDATRIGE